MNTTYDGWNTNFYYVGDVCSAYSADFRNNDEFKRFISKNKTVVRIQPMSDGSSITSIFKGKLS